MECVHFLLLQPIRAAESHHIPLGFRSHHECVREVETSVHVCVSSPSPAVFEFCGPVDKRLWSFHISHVQHILILLCLLYRKII